MSFLYSYLPLIKTIFTVQNYDETALKKHFFVNNITVLLN